MAIKLHGLFYNRQELEVMPAYYWATWGFARRLNRSKLSNTSKLYYPLLT